MPHHLHHFLSYLKYWLYSVDKHSLQAPFIYDLYTGVIRNDKKAGIFSEIEAIRQRFQKSLETIGIEDLGAGSHVSRLEQRKISQIAKNGITAPKYSRLLYHLSTFLDARNIVELGTSIGINTLYLSHSNESKATITTFEAASELVTLSKSLFHKEKRDNIKVVHGNIDQQLPVVINSIPEVDLAFFDANHRKIPTLHYFNVLSSKAHSQSCFVFDDIHWSVEMESAWFHIRQHKDVTLSIDLFQFGLIFFNRDLQKQHYILEV